MRYSTSQMTTKDSVVYLWKLNGIHLVAQNLQRLLQLPLACLRMLKFQLDEAELIELNDLKLDAKERLIQRHSRRWRMVS